MMGKTFSRWEPLKQKTFENIPREPGVYLIRCWNHPICRLLGTDQEGVLDIGESGNLKRRIRLFLACASGSKKRGHYAGCRFHRLGLARHFPIEELEFKWKVAKSEEKARALEGKQLRKYERKFGELPPLNSQSSKA